MAICQVCGAYDYARFKCRKCGGKMTKAGKRYRPLIQQAEWEASRVGNRGK